ncbi:M14 family metallopeptidase [Jeotgalibacillus proteolyticus]|uniref:Peptidase M14 n=1 Tax=Jeotgalibacillus proteolyticus TaxID=2082395 RepID=A0A2S5GEJ7_9BACL|nr:M14 family metallopeptidase [Jeotgalibacillus proteolyticus]PPA71409.1 peptidase M14 [Jeotgalibacillus proteolyticus]
MDILVRQNDTFALYSRIFSVPLELIIDSNPTANPNRLMIGQTIKIPGYIAWQYTVQPGDSFWSIHRKFNIPLERLTFVNPLVQPQSLAPGNLLRIPSRAQNEPASRAYEYSPSNLSQDFTRLKSVYPFIEQTEIGSSVEGRPLYLLRIGKGSRLVQWNASFHANEWITTPILMSLLDEHLWHISNNQSNEHQRRMNAYRGSTLYVVGMVNPDGVELVINGPSSSNEESVVKINGGSTDFSGWKANINGVDLNDQFPAGWELEKERTQVTSPAPRDFPGNAPLDQPESKTMAQIAENIPFQMMIALHTQGAEFYWGYEGLEPPESAKYAALFSELSGYRSVQYVDSHAGYKDWYIAEFRKPGFTFELGRGVNPLPLSQFPEIYTAMKPVFIQSLMGLPE